MQCHECGREVADVDRFCTACGASLRNVTEPTRPIATATTTDDRVSFDPDGAGRSSREQPVEIVSADGDWDVVDPVWAPTAPQAAIAVDTSQLPETEPITEVQMEAPVPVGAVDAEPTAVQPAAPATATMPVQPTAPAGPARRFQLVAVTLLAVVTAVVALVGFFADLLSITSSTRLVVGDDAPAEFRTGTWILDDLADNLSIAGLVAVSLLVAGGMAAGAGWRWGSGMAGGAGLALAGLAALALGLAQIPIDAAHEFARIPADEPFTLSITRDLGYWLLLASGALGVVVFFASLNDAGRDRRSYLNPWIAALGALAALIAAAGPLLPVNRAELGDNWFVDELGGPPALLLAARLMQLGIVAVAGLIGFLSVRVWGLGLVAGASLPSVWLAASVLLSATDDPIGPGYRNPGAVDGDLHGVTIIGSSFLVAMLLLAVIGAYDQWARARH